MATVITPQLNTEHTNHLLQRLIYLEKLFNSSAGEVGEIENSFNQVNQDIDKLYNCIILSGEYYHPNAQALVKAIADANENLLTKALPGLEEQLNKRLGQISLNNKELIVLPYVLQDTKSKLQQPDITEESKISLEAKISEIQDKLNAADQNKVRLDKEARRLQIYQSFLKTAREKIETYKKYNKHLIYLLDYIDTRLNKTDVIVLDTDLASDIVKYRELALEDKSKKEYAAYFIFLVNVRLAETDEAYLCNRQTLVQLIGYAKNLHELSEREAIAYHDKDRIVECVKQKCRFLILKILRRFKRTDSSEFKTSATTKSLKFSIGDLQNDIALFKTLDAKSLKHYFSDPVVGLTNDICLEQMRSLIASGKDSIIGAENEIECIHFLFKFVKNSAKEIIQGTRKIKLEDLKKLFTDLLSYYYDKTESAKKDDKFNLFSFESAVILTSNALFILEVTEKIERCANIKDCREALKFLQDEFDKNVQELHSDKAPNVLLYRNYFELLSQCLIKFTFLLENISAEDIPNLEGLVKQLEEIFQGCYAASTNYVSVINKAIQKILYPTYLSIKECIITTDILISISGIPDLSEKAISQPNNVKLEGPENVKKLVVPAANLKLPLNLFIDSSYILPSNYEQLLKNADIKILEIKNLGDQIYHKLFNREINIETRKFEKKIDDKVKESQWSAIQIIGLMQRSFHLC